MLDIVVIGRNRHEYLKQCVKAIEAYTENYRLTYIDDYSDIHSDFVLRNREKFHQIVMNGDNMGSTPSMNTGLHLAHLWQWYYDEPGQDPICFLEDDMIVKEGWQDACKKVLEKFEEKFKIGFISCHDAEEHKTESEISLEGYKIKIKDIIRSSFMYARKSHWRSIDLIPRLNTDGTERGKPHAGKGSRRDWYLLKDGGKSNQAQGKKCAVICGYAEHIAEDFNLSTWKQNAKKVN